LFIKKKKSGVGMKRRLILLIVVVLLVGSVLTACGTKDNKAALTEPVKIALSPWPGWFIWYLVKEKGFFEKRGVNVELVYFPVYSDSLSALSTGKVDANSQTLSDTLAPASKGIGLKAVLVNDNSNGGDGFIVKEGIQSFADLKGKKVATELGTVDHLLMLTALDKHGLKENDVKYTNMTVNDAGPAFISGNLDAAVLWEPFLSKALAEGKGKLLFSSKDTPGLIPDLLVFKESVTKNRPDDVKKILLAWFDALEYWKNNPDESLAIMAKAAETPVAEYKLGVDSVRIFSKEDNQKAFTEGTDYTSLFFTANKTAEFLKGLEMLSSIPDPKAFLDGSFIDEIIKESK
jgi:NitT/TauT family transport system substrate-binding protein